MAASGHATSATSDAGAAGCPGSRRTDGRAPARLIAATRYARPVPLPLEPKPPLTASVREHDPRSFEVARLLCDAIAAARPDAAPEHVGSTAVPGLPGKGVIDLLIPADPAGIRSLTASLLDLGFHRQRNRDPFPPTRPMLEAALRHDGDLFIIHVHVVPSADPEVSELRGFRDALRGDPVLREAYAAEKRRVVSSGVTDTTDYAVEKGRFVEQALRHLGLRPSA